MNAEFAQIGQLERDFQQAWEKSFTNEEGPQIDGERVILQQTQTIADTASDVLTQAYFPIAQALIEKHFPGNTVKTVAHIINYNEKGDYATVRPICVKLETRLSGEEQWNVTDEETGIQLVVEDPQEIKILIPRQLLGIKPNESFLQ